VTATCHTGQKVIGGGAGVEGGYSGESVLNTTRPEDGADAGTKRDDAWIAFADDYGSLDQQMEAIAICAKPQDLAGSLHYKTDEVLASTDSQGHAKAKCGHGAAVLGGGTSNPGAYNQADVAGTRPEAGQAWSGFVDNFSNAPLDVAAYGICLG
jgi:hypothetical protein